MNHQRKIRRIGELFSRWYAQIKLNNALGYYDINKISEDLALKLLNETFDLNLVDLNKEKENYPGIDLGDYKKKLCYQVTSRTDAKKIKETLEKYTSSDLDLQNIFSNKIYFLILSFDPVKLGKTNYKKILESFEPGKQIITIYELIKAIDSKIKEFPIKGDKIISILEGEFEPGNFKIAEKLYKFSADYLKKYDEDQLAKSFLIDLENRLIPKNIKARISEFQEIKTFLNPNLSPFYSVYYPLSISSNQQRKIKLTKGSIGSLFQKNKYISIF